MRYEKHETFEPSLSDIITKKISMCYITVASSFMQEWSACGSHSLNFTSFHLLRG